MQNLKELVAIIGMTSLSNTTFVRERAAFVGPAEFGADVVDSVVDDVAVVAGAAVFSVFPEVFQH